MPTTITTTSTIAPDKSVIEEKFPEIRMALSKSEEELEAQIRSMKHLPPPPPPAPGQPAAAKKATGGKLPPTTLRQESSLKVALPPVVISDSRRAAAAPGRRLHHQFEAEYDREADMDFYKDFKFTFVCLPLPTDALPRKYRTLADPPPFAVAVLGGGQRCTTGGRMRYFVDTVQTKNIVSQVNC